VVLHFPLPLYGTNVKGLLLSDGHFGRFGHNGHFIHFWRFYRFITILTYGAFNYRSINMNNQFNKLSNQFCDLRYSFCDLTNQFFKSDNSLSGFSQPLCSLNAEHADFNTLLFGLPSLLNYFTG
jgi:hypothetical protein